MYSITGVGQREAREQDMIRIYTTPVQVSEDGTIENPHPDEIVIDGTTYTPKQ